MYPHLPHTALVYTCGFSKSINIHPLLLWKVSNFDNKLYSQPTYKSYYLQIELLKLLSKNFAFSLICSWINCSTTKYIYTIFYVTTVIPPKME